MWNGAAVIAAASRPSFPYLRSIGVAQLIDDRRERFEEKVREVDVVIDPLGGDTQARSWGVLRPRGMLINRIGELDEKAARKAGVRGVEFGMEYDTDDLAQIVRRVSKGLIQPHVSRVMPPERARQALDLNEQGRSHGKIVLEVR